MFREPVFIRWRVMSWDVHLVFSLLFYRRVKSVRHVYKSYAKTHFEEDIRTCVWQTNHKSVHILDRRNYFSLKL